MRSKKVDDGAVNGVGETSMISNHINDTLKTELRAQFNKISTGFQALKRIN